MDWLAEESFRVVAGVLVNQLIDDGSHNFKVC